MKKDSDSVQATMKSQTIEIVQDMMRFYTRSSEVPKYQTSNIPSIVHQFVTDQWSDSWQDFFLVLCWCKSVAFIGMNMHTFYL